MKDAAIGNQQGDITSVQDFDAGLASEIEDALVSAGVGGSDDTLGDVIGTEVKASTKEDAKENGMAPIQNNMPREPELPPHTALAQVVANQYGIDLNTVSPSSSTPGSKITADDVEYHAWKLSQPPSTAEAIELAHKLGLDLNEIYDDEDRQYIIELSDVKLYQENSRSLRMTSQTKKGKQYTLDPQSRKQAKKERELDRRMEQNMGKLSEKAMKLAGTVTGGIAQQVQQAIGLNGIELLKGRGILTGINGKDTGDIKTVEDFDADLASVIQEALSSANANDDISENEAMNQSLDGIIEQDSEDQTSVGTINDNEEKVEHSAPSVRFTEEELQSFTCVQLKELLRRRGLKMSGKKAELVERLLEEDQAVASVNGDDSGEADIENGSPLFFANPQ